MKKNLLYGISQENLMKIVPILQDQGARVHLLKNDELNEILLDVLEKTETFEFEEPKYPMSLCLFAGYSRGEIYEVIDALTSEKIKKPVFATVTEKNLSWQVGRILVDVNQEHLEMQRMAEEDRLK